MNKSIYIADDEKHIRELISSFLSNEGFQVTVFESGDDLLKCFKEHPCDMVILDIMMDGTDGLSICSQIRKTHYVPIIIVSARDSEIDRITGISLGSDDYLVKPFSPLELVARVKALFRRIQLDKIQIDKQDSIGDIVSYGDITLNICTREALINGKYLELTPTEFSLMVYLFHNCKRAVSREELLKNVWKIDFEADTRAVDDTLKRLRKKLTVSRVKIESVWGFGFRLALEGNS